MNDVNEILCFLNELVFTDRMNDDNIENLRCVKQHLFIEFEDCNSSKLIQTLNIIDEINVLIMTNSLDSGLEKKQTLYGNSYSI